MSEKLSKRFLVIASCPNSLLNFRRELLCALVGQHFKVHVAAPGLASHSRIRDQLEELGIHAHNIFLARTGTNPLIDLVSIFKLCFLVYKIKPHFLLSYTIKPVIYGNICGWLLRVPNKFALITGLGIIFQGKRGRRIWLYPFAIILYRFALKTVDTVIFQNPDDKKLFFDKSLINTQRTRTTVSNGSGVNISEFQETEFPKQIRFLLIARFLGNKGIREYVQAAKIIKNNHPDIGFDLVGWIDANPDSITKEELESWIDSGTVNYLGRVDNIKPMISKCSVYVLPSYREGTPRSVLEAMAMGRPIITTDAPGCRETVINKKNGFLVPVKNVEKLSDAMFKFIDNPKLISKMGKESRLIAEKKFDVRKINEKLFAEMNIK